MTEHKRGWGSSVSDRVYSLEQYQADCLRAQIDIAIAELRRNAHLLTPDQQAELREILSDEG